MDPLQTHVRKILRSDAAGNGVEDAHIAEHEARGHRIITGGQIELDSWDMRDWRTGALIAEGDGGIEGYDAALKRLDPDGRWWHIDAVMEEVEYPRPSATEGIPPSLSDALEEWVESRATPDEEIAQVAGWTVEQVRACRID